MEHIPFNKPYLTGKETEYIKEAICKGKISGNGYYTKQCQSFFEKKYGFEKALLTTSCTDALEMAAILIDIKFGDEIIVPSYTFVSTANAFILRGAKIIFADSSAQNPNLDVEQLKQLINDKTKAIIPVHYAGVSCDMDGIMKLAHENNIYVIEDAAQAVDSYYKDKPLGSIGHLSTFSFHETKNIISGEGGMLVINDPKFIERAEIIWEKGTNRAAFWRGEVDKYNWVDIGSSFLPSEVVAAFLYAQLEKLEEIQAKRLEIWNYYQILLHDLEKIGEIKIPMIPSYASNNAHMFYILCKNIDERSLLIKHLKKCDVDAVFHYLPLHNSPYFKEKHDARVLKNSEFFADNLLRLPFYYTIEKEKVDYVVQCIYDFYEKK